jgi:septal ring factor EnvC (AmiA/AmiB activator)
MLKKVVIVATAILLSGALLAQPTREEVTRKQKELQNEIAELNKTLAEIKGHTKESLAAVALVKRKISAREQLVNNINKDLRIIDDNIYLTQLEMNRMRRDIDTLKQNYAKSILFAYKNRSNYNYLNFLFSSTSFNDAIKRLNYLRAYRRFREAQANAILKTQKELEAKAGFLKQSQAEKGNALKEQNSQLQVLVEDRKEQETALKELKNNEKDVVSNIRKRESERKKLRASLMEIIRREQEAARIAAAKARAEAEAREKERRRRLEEERKANLEAQRQAALAKKAAAGTKNNTPANGTNSKDTKENDEPEVKAPPVVKTTPKEPEPRAFNDFEATREGLENSVNFERSRGQLSWPISSGIITGYFGTQTIPGTTIKENNDGLVFQTPKGASIRCVADGTVSYVLPDEDFYMVVVRHGKYLTVYNFLESASVQKGQTVHAGTPIGTASTEEDGRGHFEFQVMEGTRFVNPQLWLRKSR